MATFVPHFTRFDKQFPIAAAPRRRRADAQAVRLALGVGLAMAVTIGGTVFTESTIALFSMVLLALAITAYATRDVVLSIVLLFVFLGMEGMYKYLTHFSQLVYVIRPLLIGWIFVCWRLSFYFRRSKPVPPPMPMLLSLFVAWAFLAVFNPFGGGFASGLATSLLFYIGPVAFYWIAYNHVRASRQVLLFCYVLVAVCTVISAFTIVQFSMGRPWTEAHLPGYDSIFQGDWFVVINNGPSISAFRPASTTSTGGGGSVWSSLGMLTAFGLLFLPHLRRSWKLVLAVCLLVNGVGLLLCGVRLFLFVTAFGMVIFLCIVARSPREAMRSLGSLLLVVFVVAGMWSGAQFVSGGIIASRYMETLANPLEKFQKERGGNLVALGNLMVSYPLGSGYHAGLGYGQGADRTSDQQAMQARNGETQFGAITGDMGVPGLILLLALMIKSITLGWRAMRRLRDPQMRTLGALLFASLSGYFVACFGGPAMQGSIHYWFAAAMLAVLPAIEKRELAPPEPAGPPILPARARRP